MIQEMFIKDADKRHIPMDVKQDYQSLINNDIHQRMLEKEYQKLRFSSHARVDQRMSQIREQTRVLQDETDTILRKYNLSHEDYATLLGGERPDHTFRVDGDHDIRRAYKIGESDEIDDRFYAELEELRDEGLRYERDM